MSDDTDNYPRATPLTPEQLHRAYAHAQTRLFCKNGHELSGDNLAMRKDRRGIPRPVCRQCNCERAKRWRQINAERLERKPGQKGKTLRRDTQDAAAQVAT